MRITLIITLMAIIVASCLISRVSADPQDSEPPIVDLINPPYNGTIYDKNPIVVILFADRSGVDPSTAQLRIDERDMSSYFDPKINETAYEIKIDSLFTLLNGKHNLTFEIKDKVGNIAIVNTTFTVTDKPESKFKVPLPSTTQLVTVIGILLLLFFIIMIGLYIYLRIRRNFRLKKFLITHPVQQKYLIIYIPILVSIIFTTVGLFYINEHPDVSAFGFEIVLLIGFFIALTPFTVDSQLELRKKNAYEAAFAQLLFEIADAMRGGIDPAKAIVEIAKNDNSVMSKYLRIAAKNILAGRSFEEALDIVAFPSKSRMVRRYATLIAESTKIGGNIAIVVHRAARDLDDLVKIKAERRRQMAIQTVVVYMALGVLLVILYMLMDIYPKFESLDISILSGGGIGSAGSGKVAAKMGLLTLQRRFFHLALIIGIGSGMIIGMINEGKVKYGFMHSLILAISIILIFVFLIF